MAAFELFLLNVASLKFLIIITVFVFKQLYIIAKPDRSWATVAQKKAQKISQHYKERVSR